MKAEMIPRAALCVALTLSCLACAPAPEEPAQAGPEGHRWTPIETDADSELETAKEQIAALAYLKGDQAAPEQIGVQVIDAERAQPGLNLVLSAHRTAAFLMDLEGTFLHRWELDPTTAGHGLEELPDDVVWPRAHLYPNGDLLVVYQASADAETGALVKIDRDSNLLWARLDAYHHDFWVAESGNIHVLNQKTVTLPWFRDTPVYDTPITVLDSDGERLREIEAHQPQKGLRSAQQIRLPAVVVETAVDLAVKLVLGGEDDLPDRRDGAVVGELDPPVVAFRRRR